MEGDEEEGRGRGWRGWEGREAEDFVLFVHLIPCCQHFVADSEPKVEFEAAMNARKTRYASRKRFLAYLLNHPVNRGIGQLMPSKDLEAIRALNASWELIICLMRNIVCHEYCYEWSAVREMMRISIGYFGGRQEIARMLHLYATLVLGETPVPLPSTEDGHQPDQLARADCLQSSDVQHEQRESESQELSILSTARQDKELCQDILLFAQLIPCRSNNAIVDIQFEEEMSALAEERHFGNWEAFAEFLKTHPANPRQWITPSHEISWIMVVRLMRNIFCHERSMKFCGLRQFVEKTLNYFRDRSNFHTFLARYQRFCHSPPNRSAQCLSVFPAAEIQIPTANNFCVWESPSMGRHRELFCGVRGIENFIRRCFPEQPSNDPSSGSSTTSLLAPNDLSATHRTKIAALVVGGRGSGRTSAALMLAHHISASSEVDSVPLSEHSDASSSDTPLRNLIYFDVSADGGMKSRELLPEGKVDRLLRSIVRRLCGHEDEGDDEGESDARVKLRTALARRDSKRRVVVILDDFHLLVTGFKREQQRKQMMILLHDLIAELADDLFFVLTAPAYLALYLYYFIDTGDDDEAQRMDSEDRHKENQELLVSANQPLKRKADEDGRKRRQRKRTKTKSPGRSPLIATSRKIKRRLLKPLHVFDIPSEAPSETEMKQTELLLRHYHLPHLHKHHLKAILFNLEATQVPLHASLLTSLVRIWTAEQHLFRTRPDLQSGFMLTGEDEEDEQATEENSTEHVLFTTLANPTQQVVHQHLERVLASVHSDLAGLFLDERSDFTEPHRTEDHEAGLNRFLGLLHECISGVDDRPKGPLWASVLAKTGSRWYLKDIYLHTIVHFFLERVGSGEDPTNRREEGEQTSTSTHDRWLLKPWTQSGSADSMRIPPVALLTHVAHLCRTLRKSQP